MKRISIVGLCLVCAFALSAIASSSAFAGVYGTCTKAAKEGKKYTGKYTDKNCNTLASEAEIAEGKKNKYEFTAYPGAAGTKWGYTSKTKTATLKSAAGEITCKASTDKGSITGAKTDVDQVTFTTCVLSVTGGKCTSAGEAAGTIKTGELKTLLIDHGETGPSGKEPAEGEAWTAFEGPGGPETPSAEFVCEPGIPFTTVGSTSGVDTPVNVVSNKGKSTFSSTGGEQDLVSIFFNPLTSKVEEAPSEEITVGEDKFESKIEIKT
jgi:hypothetical protein